MQKDDSFYFGRIVKTHGLKGEITIRIDDDRINPEAELKYFLVEINGKKVPYFVESVVYHSNKLYVSVQDIKTLEAASNLVGKDVFLSNDMRPQLDEGEFTYDEIIGFKLIDEKKGELGEVSDVIEYPTQSVIQVFVNGKEVLIPFHEDIVKSVDKEAKSLTVSLPEGLVEMYLGL